MVTFFCLLFPEMQPDPLQKLQEFASSIAEDKDLFLVDIEIVPESGTDVVWIYLDAEDRGVTLDEYAEVSTELAFVLEAHEVFENKYRLNVSSPGLSRPLSDKRQYVKNVGRKAKVKFKKEDFGKIEGTLTHVDEHGISIQPKKGDTMQVLFEEIIETKIVPAF